MNADNFLKRFHEALSRHTLLLVHVKMHFLYVVINYIHVLIDYYPSMVTKFKLVIDYQDAIIN